MGNGQVIVARVRSGRASCRALDEPCSLSVMRPFREYLRKPRSGRSAIESPGELPVSAPEVLAGYSLRVVRTIKV